MKAFLLCASLALGALLCGRPAHADNRVQHADSLLAAAGTFKVYAMFCANCGHIHSPQFITPDNGYDYGAATSGFVYSSLSALRVKLWGSAFVDTSGFTLPAGLQYTFSYPVDSLSVLNTGGTQTTVTSEVRR